MLSRIPALELLHQLSGSYADRAEEVTLRIWPCGYGAAIDLAVKGKSILCGVAGAHGPEIECFVQIGLPNVTRTTGKIVSEAELLLVGDEPPFEVRFNRSLAGVGVAISFNGKEKVAYALHAV